MGFSGENNVASFVDKEKIDFAEVFEMVDVNGSEAHPILTFLKSKRPGCISWNFTKFVVNKNGRHVEKFNHQIPFSTKEQEIKLML